MEKIIKEKNIIKKNDELEELNNLKIELNNFFKNQLKVTHILKKNMHNCKLNTL